MDCHLELSPPPIEMKASREGAFSENGLCDRFADAKPGEAITYHTGNRSAFPGNSQAAHALG